MYKKEKERNKKQTEDGDGHKSTLSTKILRKSSDQSELITDKGL